MTPPRQPPRQPLSVPHSMTRVPTQPQPQVPVYDPRQEQAEQPPEEDDVTRLARRVDSDGFTVETIIQLGGLLMERAVIRTQQGEKLKRDQQVGLDQSQTIMSLTGQLRRSRIINGLLLGLASSVGAVAASCAQGYQDRKVEILEPIGVAEGKAARAEKKVEAVELTTEERLDAADKRVTKIEESLGDVKSALKANTDAVLAITAMLSAQQPASKKKP